MQAEYAEKKQIDALAELDAAMLPASVSLFGTVVDAHEPDPLLLSQAIDKAIDAGVPYADLKKSILALDSLPKVSAALDIQRHWRGKIARNQGVQDRTLGRFSNLRASVHWNKMINATVQGTKDELTMARLGLVADVILTYPLPSEEEVREEKMYNDRMKRHAQRHELHEHRRRRAPRPARPSRRPQRERA